MNPSTLRDPSAPRLYVLVPCAGVGTRAGEGGPKQYRPLAGRAMVAWTLQALAHVRRLSATLVVLSSDDLLFESRVSDFVGERNWVVRRGGTTRADTVANGIAKLVERGARPDDWVLVHDAARCLVRPEWIERLIDACRVDAVGGLLALPLADTLKEASRDERVARTLDRGGKWLAQTPQMFRVGLLREAIQRAGPRATDEASAIEAAGHAPLLVRGEFENFKLTWPSDFELAERLLATRHPHRKDPRT